MQQSCPGKLCHFIAGTVVQKDNTHVTEETAVAKSVNSVLHLLKHYIAKIEDRQCGFRRNTSSTDRNFCIPNILEKGMGVN
jgi:hypothetical protein